jgi:hypothetical protein
MGFCCTIGTTFLCLYFGGASVWTQGLCLLYRCFATWGTHPALFSLIVCEIEYCFLPRLSWNQVPAYLSFLVSRMTGTPHLIQLLVDMGSCELCPGWPETAFQVSRIVGKSHWCLARMDIFTRKCRINRQPGDQAWGRRAAK